MNTGINYNIESVQSSIDNIQTNITEIEAQQTAINTYLSAFRETWTSSGSANVFEKLESFVSSADTNSTLSAFITDVSTKLTQLEAALAHLQEIDRQGGI